MVDALPRQVQPPRTSDVSLAVRNSSAVAVAVAVATDPTALSSLVINAGGGATDCIGDGCSWNRCKDRGGWRWGLIVAEASLRGALPRSITRAITRGISRGIPPGICDGVHHKILLGGAVDGGRSVCRTRTCR